MQSHMFGCVRPCLNRRSVPGMPFLPCSRVPMPSPRRRMSQGQMNQMARHLKAEHLQGVHPRLMQPPGGRPPSQPRVPIHLMMPHRTNLPGSGASSRQPTPNASNSVLQSRIREAPTHIVPKTDVYGFALTQPPAGPAARQLRSMDRGPEVPEHWARSPTHKGNSVMNGEMLSGLGHPVDVPPYSCMVEMSP